MPTKREEKKSAGDAHLNCQLWRRRRKKKVSIKWLNHRSLKAAKRIGLSFPTNFGDFRRRGNRTRKENKWPLGGFPCYFPIGAGSAGACGRRTDIVGRTCGAEGRKGKKKGRKEGRKDGREQDQQMAALNTWDDSITDKSQTACSIQFWSGSSARD